MDERKKPDLDGVIPNDGTYLATKKAKQLREKKLKEDFDKAWESQNNLLKDSTVKLYLEKTTISLRWQSSVDYEDNALVKPMRVKKGLNTLGRGKFPHTANAVKTALKIAEEIDLKIKANAFSWQDYPQWLPKKLRPKNTQAEKLKTIAEWMVEYEQDYWLSRNKKDFKNHRNWKNGYLLYLQRIRDMSQQPSKEIFDEVCANYPKSKKRNECCTRIKSFAHFCGLSDYDPKQFRLRNNQIEVKAKPKRELTDREVEIWYDKFPQWIGIKGSPSQWELWQWMYGIQATYGFRNHESLNIFNLDCEYLGGDGRLYPPFTDKKKNPRGIIYTEGKGVKRAAFLPQPLRWLERFNLRKPPKKYYDFMRSLDKLDNYEKEEAKHYKLHTYSKFLKEHGFTFTAYNLRHHYNVKSHNLGIPVNLIAKNLGHTVLQNTTTYLSSQGLKSCLDALDSWQKRQQDIETDDLSSEQQIQLLREENEQLKAVLQSLLESIKSND